MGADIGHDCNARVPRNLANYLGVSALTTHQACSGISEIMELDLPTHFLRYLDEVMRHGVWGEGLAFTRDRHEKGFSEGDLIKWIKAH